MSKFFQQKNSPFIQKCKAEGKRACNSCGITKQWVYKERHSRRNSPVYVDENGGSWSGGFCRDCYLLSQRVRNQKAKERFEEYYVQKIKALGREVIDIKKTRQCKSPEALHQSSVENRVHSDNETYVLLSGQRNEIYLASGSEERT